MLYGRLSGKTLISALAAAVFCAAPAFADGNGNLGVLKAGVDLSMANLSFSVENFHNLRCLTPDAKTHLENVQTSAEQVSQSFGKQYGNYVAAVTKPMQGNGKCDGGFNSVAIESAARRSQTESFAMKMYNLQMQYATAMDADFTQPTIDFEDESDSQRCSADGDKMYETTKVNTALANDSFNLFRSGVTTLAQRFRAYTLTNAGLGNGCGTLPGDLTGQLFVGGAQPVSSAGMVPQGESLNPSSTITGKIDDSSLSESGATSTITRPGAIELAGAGNPSSASTASLGDKAERDASVSSFSAKIAETGHSAEMDVQALVKNGDIAGLLAGRNPASEGSTPKAASAVVPSAKETASPAWNAGIAGSCFALEKCTGAKLEVMNAGECPADKRYFLQSLPGGVCQRLPPK